MLSVTDDVEVVKRFGGGKSDAIHAYWYTDLASAPERGQRMLHSKPVLQPQQHAAPPAPNPSRSVKARPDPAIDTRCGGPKPHIWRR